MVSAPTSGQIRESETASANTTLEEHLPHAQGRIVTKRQVQSGYAKRLRAAKSLAAKSHLGATGRRSMHLEILPTRAPLHGRTEKSSPRRDFRGKTRRQAFRRAPPRECNLELFLGKQAL